MIVMNVFLQIHTTAKHKTRGKWVNVPFTNHIKNICDHYFEPGQFWYERITKYFEGGARECPPAPMVNFQLSFNCLQVNSIVNQSATATN